jgi:hypothetical protein
MTIPALLLIAAAQAAAADSVSAERAVKTQHSEMRVLTEMDCPRSGDAEEIVVCGRRTGDAATAVRLRIPYQPEPGRRIPGEANFDGGGCMRLCHRPVEIFNTRDGGAIGALVKGIKQVLED